MTDQTDKSALAGEADLAFIRAIAECAAQRGPIRIDSNTGKNMVAAIDRIAASCTAPSQDSEAVREAALREAAAALEDRAAAFERESRIRGKSEGYFVDGRTFTRAAARTILALIPKETPDDAE